jgi:hypothetical protein
MANFVTRNGIKTIPGRVNAVEYDGVSLTCMQLAKKLGMPVTMISNRVHRHIYSGMPFDDIFKQSVLVKKGCDVDGVTMYSTEIAEITGCTITATKVRMKKYRDSPAYTKEDLLKKTTSKRPKHLASWKPKVAEVKTRLTLKEIDAEYSIALRKHKLSTRSHCLGSRGKGGCNE